MHLSSIMNFIHKRSEYLAKIFQLLKTKSFQYKIEAKLLKKKIKKIKKNKQKNIVK